MALTQQYVPLSTLAVDSTYDWAEGNNELLFFSLAFIFDSCFLSLLGVHTLFFLG